MSDRYDNMITYQTPSYAGVQATFQYSFKQDTVNEASTAREGSAASDRYAAAAVTGDFGPLALVAAYEYQNRASDGSDADHDDAHTLYIGGNYDCGFAKTFVMGQYFKGLNTHELAFFDYTHGAGDDAKGIDDVSKEGVKGFGLHLGTVFPVASGDVTVAVYYVNGELEKATIGAAPATDVDLSYIGLAARYTYPLSKRTSLYAGAGYSQTKYETSKVAANLSDVKDKVAQAYLGLTHTF